MKIPVWQWNEMQQIGTDYADIAEVEAYDKRMASFRDITSENQQIIQNLNLPVGAAILEIGCGTGRFARYAASIGYVVTAIDVSPIMLEYLGKKVIEENLPAIKTIHTGFLTMDFADYSFDAVISAVALHHLPDVWKYVALQKIAKVLKPGGKFILRDVVFTIKDVEPAVNCISRFVESFNNQIKPGAITHAKREYSTFDWIMAGMLCRAGFEIISQNIISENIIEYNCEKKDEY